MDRVQLVECPATAATLVWRTMIGHNTYGTSTHTAGELTRLISDRIGLVFTERDSGGASTTSPASPGSKYSPST